MKCSKISLICPNVELLCHDYLALSDRYVNSGFLYLAADIESRVLKVGKTSNCPFRRCQVLDLPLTAIRYARKNLTELENTLIAHASAICEIHSGREFFEYSQQSLEEIIRLNSLIEVHSLELKIASESARIFG